jgi:N-acetylmuramoyl-L-alanine amidase
VLLLLSLGASLALGARLTPLATEPDWASLDAYQRTITREDFTALLDQHYAPDKAFLTYAVVESSYVEIFSDAAKTQRLWRLEFAQDALAARPLPLHPESEGEPTSASELPLAGRVICLDPGHIGGNWAQLEERSFQLGADAAVEEAKLNLWASHWAEKGLTAAGARVVWTKRNEEPVTPLRPKDLRLAALAAMFTVDGYRAYPTAPLLLDRRIEQRAASLFYRTAEIRARAERVRELQPDVTLCVHFNAAPWSGAPSHARLVPQSRLVVFVSGQYSVEELSFDDQKFELLQRLLRRQDGFELGLAEKIAQELVTVWGMPPENYQNWPAVRRVGSNPYVYARNLLANRIFPGPVVFVEGPYMNARDAYPRLIAGDYEGTRIIEGKVQRSIFAEFGEALTQAVVKYYAPQN